MPPTTDATRAVRLRVLLPEEISTRYQEEADELGMDIETLLSKRLTACVEYTAEKPIYFDDLQRQELEQMLAKNIFSTRDLMTLIRNCVSLRVNNLKITLQPGLLSRLKTRCLGVKWETFLEKIVVEDLERYVGMR